MTTNKQLQEWLKRFDDDVVMKVIVTRENSGSYYSYTDVNVDDLILPTQEVHELVSWEDYDNTSFDVDYCHEDTTKSKVISITLGKEDA